MKLMKGKRLVGWPKLRSTRVHMHRFDFARPVFEDGEGGLHNTSKAACGRVLVAEVFKGQPEDVTCKACRKTRVFRYIAGQEL